MLDDTFKRWHKLCEQASLEHNPKKFHALVREIDRLLQEKENRLRKQEKDLFKRRNTSH
jgi:hypothetical protein